jgi:hypothetical protein
VWWKDESVSVWLMDECECSQKGKLRVVWLSAKWYIDVQPHEGWNRSDATRANGHTSHVQHATSV